VIDMTTVINVGSKNAMAWSPKQVLEEAIAAIGERGAFERGEKLIVIALDDTDGNYGASFIQSGMRSSEIIALLEVLKQEMLANMGYGREP
jgi:hypothetical protein